MNIIAIQYTLEHRSFDIYIAGCNGGYDGHCAGCHNPESWDFNQGALFDDDMFNEWENRIHRFPALIENIMIFGGEPLDQPIDEFLDMLEKLSVTERKIWLFTRFNFDDIDDRVKNLCDYIKCGKYIESLVVDNNIQHGIKLATRNQKIYKKSGDGKWA